MERKESELEKQLCDPLYMKDERKEKSPANDKPELPTQGPSAPSPLPMLIAKNINHRSLSPET